MLQQIATARHRSEQTARDVVAHPVVARVVAVGHRHTRSHASGTARERGHRASRARRRLARRARSRDARGRSRWHARAPATDHAAVVLAIAHLVLGDLPAARLALERARARALVPQLRALSERQLASLEHMEGNADRALARLASPDAMSSPDEARGIRLHRALVLLVAGTPSDAVTEAEAAAGLSAELMDRARGGQAQAHAADVVQATCVLARALVRAGRIGDAEAALAGRPATSGKPYLRAQVEEAEATLALARGDRVAATRHLTSAIGDLEAVGASVDLARVDVLRAVIERDRARLDGAEATLRRLGALGYLPEVERARGELDGLG